MINRILKVTLLSLLLFIELPHADAQNTQNLQSLNVDELSDDQVRGFIEKMGSSGYSQSQLEALAKARGMSPTEITKLQQRISQIQSAQNAAGTSTQINRGRAQVGEKVGDPFESIEVLERKGSEDLPIFGMSFFQNTNLTFEPSLKIATPKNYVIGPGDQIIIDLWGASEQTYQVEVSPEGSVFIPNLGPIYLNGLDLERAESRIKYKLKSIYSTLGENTFAQVSLGQIRTISINVVGEVRRPGTYQLSSFGTAFNALYLAGGPNEKGSLREIQVFRGGKKEITLDAYNFLVFGNGQNIMLQDQDILLVKPYVNRVSIEGNVKREAYYETLEGESLAQVLQFAGGFTPDAYTKSISLRRNLANQKTVQTVLFDQFNRHELVSGDGIVVGKIQNIFVNRVTINGAVNHPGEFELTENMKLSELIELVDGFSPDVFLQRALITRRNPDFTLSSITWSPEEVLSGNFDIELKSEDVINIESIFGMHEKWIVSIQGEVQKPMDVDYVNDMTVEDLLLMAGGFKESASKSFVEVARRTSKETRNDEITAEIFNFPISENLEINPNDADFKLLPFDLVVIRKSPYYQVQEVVEVEGEVLFPGRYVLNSKTERISDIIERAGGLTKDAFAEGGTLIRETEYYDEGAAALVKKLRIQALGSNDSTATRGTFAINKNESIAIELAKILNNPKRENDIILKGGDIISVPKELQTVRVRGEIYFSSNIIFEVNSNLKKYVAQSGGFAPKAKKNKTYVVYPNGSAQKTSSFLWLKKYPKILPGSEIIVPKKVARRKLSPQEIIGITTGIGTLALIINNLTR